MKVKLIKKVWNYAPGKVLNVDDNKADFLFRKGYAEKVAVVKRQKKIEPGIKTRKRK